MRGHYRQAGTRYSITRITQARRPLGFDRKIPWDDGLAELIQWARCSVAADWFIHADRELQERGSLMKAAMTPEMDEQ